VKVRYGVQDVVAAVKSRIRRKPVPSRERPARSAAPLQYPRFRTAPLRSLDRRRPGDAVDDANI